MSIFELVLKTNDHIIIHRMEEERSTVLFIGEKDDIPFCMLQLEVLVFGCLEMQVLEIQVK